MNPVIRRVPALLLAAGVLFAGAVVADELPQTSPDGLELVVEVVSSPVMPWIAVSIGVETSVFTTSGEAPG